VIVGGAILPFSSVLVPEVGRGRERPAFATLAAMRRAVRELAAFDAELVLLALPQDEHQQDAEPRIYTSGQLLARFDAFGDHETEVDATGAPEAAGAISSAGLARPALAPDVPAEAATLLYFLRPLLAHAATVVLTVPHAADAEERTAYRRLGANLAALPELASRRVAVVVGGELSQRIFPGAPAGYHRDGARFDEAVLAVLAASDLDALDGEAAALAPRAGERALAGLSLLHGMLGRAGVRFHVLGYQAPFGAGFAVATFVAGAGA